MLNILYQKIKIKGVENTMEETLTLEIKDFDSFLSSLNEINTQFKELLNVLEDISSNQSLKDLSSSITLVSSSIAILNIAKQEALLLMRWIDYYFQN
jgi:hypothetical protein